MSGFQMCGSEDRWSGPDPDSHKLSSAFGTTWARLVRRGHNDQNRLRYTTMSLVEGFAVQKWMKSRGWKREVVVSDCQLYSSFCVCSELYYGWGAHVLGKSAVRCMLYSVCCFLLSWCIQPCIPRSLESVRGGFSATQPYTSAASAS